jgi:TonB family protein
MFMHYDARQMKIHRFATAVGIWFSVLLASIFAFAQNDFEVSNVESKVTATIAANRSPGMLVDYVEPVYPQNAKDASIQGTVVLNFAVTKEGSIEQIERINGNQVLADAAIDAVKLWKFKPFELNGRPIAKPLRVWIVFVIQDNSNFKQEASSPPAARQDPKLYWVGSSVSPERLFIRVVPVYPKEASASGIQGTVLLNAVIGTDGALKNLTPVSGPRELIQPAIDAVQKWRYRPYFMDYDPVEVSLSITVNFTISISKQ